MSQLYYGDTPLSQMPARYPASRVTHESVSALLDEIFALVDPTKITCNTLIEVTFTSGGTGIYRLVGNYLPTTIKELRFSFERTTDTYYIIESYYVKETNSNIFTCQNGTITNASSGIAANGTVITLYYD